MTFFRRRFASALIMLACVCVLNFFLFHLSPGDPTNMYFSPRTSAADRDAMRAQIGLDRAWYIQLGDWTSHVLRGDLGFSWSRHKPVAVVLKEAIPLTLLLTGGALLLNLLIGISIGIISGRRPESHMGKWLQRLVLMLYSLPVFWIALLSMYLFSIELGWVPATSQFAFLENSGESGSVFGLAKHLLLPILILGITSAAVTARYVHAKTRTIAQSSFVRFAEAKGLSSWRLYRSHLLPHILVPVTTLVGLYLPFLLGGALVIEVIFAWPGIGRIMYEAIYARDYPLIMSINLLSASLVILGNAVADVIGHYLNPSSELN